MAQADKMICPDCGVEMNYHAEKIDYTAALEDASAVDTLFGGVVEEAHTCPRCGQTLLRKAGAAQQSE
jgi:ribosomal protein S27AE